MRPGWTYFLYSYWLGRAHFAGGNYARAIQIFDDLSHLYSSGRYSFPIESVKLYYYLGRAYQADDQNQKAIEQYDEFLLFWNSADAELHLIDDARQRLADLKSST
jgi:tetratricopeptide (TPR) repeat protein